MSVNTGDTHAVLSFYPTSPLPQHPTQRDPEYISNLPKSLFHPKPKHIISFSDYLTPLYTSPYRTLDPHPYFPGPFPRLQPGEP